MHVRLSLTWCLTLGITLPTLYIIKEDGDPSLKLWAQTLLVEDRADQGESIVQWISKLREKVC